MCSSEALGYRQILHTLFVLILMIVMRGGGGD
jgi:hypothetical protein